MIVACASTMQPTLLINVIQPPQTEIEHLTSKQHRNDVINYVLHCMGNDQQMLSSETLLLRAVH
jgi:hypothetical protein